MKRRRNGFVNGAHPSSPGAATPTSASSSSSSSSSSLARSDACVGTCSASTMTEPECLGPCEPGTAVTLEGIVWHETEGGMSTRNSVKIKKNSVPRGNVVDIGAAGVLVVNVTWRGKTYVGTLLDCTRHDWAPPRYVTFRQSNAPIGRCRLSALPRLEELVGLGRTGLNQGLVADVSDGQSGAAWMGR